MKLNLTEPCNQCPFRRESCPGWLGPWDARELLFVIGHYPFPCHQTMGEDDETKELDRMENCAGAALFLNRKAELSRVPDMHEHQKRLKDAPPRVKLRVFETAREFVTHHEEGKP